MPGLVYFFFSCLLINSHWPPIKQSIHYQYCWHLSKTWWLKTSHTGLKEHGNSNWHLPWRCVYHPYVHRWYKKGGWRSHVAHPDFIVLEGDIQSPWGQRKAARNPILLWILQAITKFGIMRFMQQWHGCHGRNQSLSYSIWVPVHELELISGTVYKTKNMWVDG